MTTAAKIVTILIVRFESSEAFVSKSKCIYRNSWTEWPIQNGLDVRHVD